MSLKPRNRHIPQLNSVADRPQHQRPPAHIPTPNKLIRKHQAFPQNTRQRFHIFWRRNTSEKHHFIPRPHLRCQSHRITFQRHPVSRIGATDRHFRHFIQQFGTHPSTRRQQSLRGSNDKHGRLETCRRPGERRCVSKFPSEIKPANKTENISKRSARKPQARRKFKARARPQKNLSPPPRQISGRKQEKPFRAAVRNHAPQGTSRVIAQLYQRVHANITAHAPKHL